MFTAWMQLAYRQTKCTVMTKNNKDMAILPANKGLVTVRMDRTDYHNKMNALVNNKQTYAEFKGDLTPALQPKLNSNLLTLKKMRLLTLIATTD